MATIKSFTNLSQSKTLSKILSLESADFCYFKTHVRDNWMGIPEYEFCSMPHKDYSGESIGCWSLTALLSVLPNPSLHETFSGWRCDSYNKEFTSCILGESSDNPIDACYEMILKLHEQNLL